MADETPAPLSDAEIAELREQLDGRVRYWGVTWIASLLASLAARDAHIADLNAREAAMREIVAAVADGWSNALGTRVGETAADGLALKARARALLAGTQTPATAQAAENGEA